MSKPNLMKYAKKIRKEGEAWKDAVARAAIELSVEKQPTDVAEESKPSTKVEKEESALEEKREFSGMIRGQGESYADFVKRKRTL